jgi:hypothetical protein
LKGLDRYRVDYNEGLLGEKQNVELIMPGRQGTPTRSLRAKKNRGE